MCGETHIQKPWLHTLQETAVHLPGPIQTFILFTGLETLPAQTHSNPRDSKDEQQSTF